MSSPEHIIIEGGTTGLVVANRLSTRLLVHTLSPLASHQAFGHTPAPRRYTQSRIQYSPIYHQSLRLYKLTYLNQHTRPGYQII